MASRLQAEREFFDRVASRTRLRPMSRAVLDRYAHPPHPELFGKEWMFSLLGPARGLRVLEVGCGEGAASVQLAYCGAQVTGIDVSPGALDVARRRAALERLDVEFVEANVEDGDGLGDEAYDVVWCDLVLHHLTASLDRVVRKLHAALKPGGLFVAREPVHYAGWLKALRRCVPVRVPTTPDEQPFREQEFAAVRRHFPDLHRRHFRLFARLDRVTRSLPVIGMAARVDNLLLHLPGAKSLAGNVVMWARKPATAA